ncbi:hypothetical protein Scep_014617 [Stephania cephalantha]|uniref:Uncharacterized protein n=1 Tax=Stephania cephalantha TaxID=152367 RepID=A0AAP0P374_9MAGN
MWETSMKGLISLIQKSTPSSFTYICEKNGDSLSDKMDVLACFAPRMLALGSLGYGPGDHEKMLTLAEEEDVYQKLSSKGDVGSRPDYTGHFCRDDDGGVLQGGGSLAQGFEALSHIINRFNEEVVVHSNREMRTHRNSKSSLEIRSRFSLEPPTISRSREAFIEVVCDRRSVLRIRSSDAEIASISSFEREDREGPGA